MPVVSMIGKLMGSKAAIDTNSQKIKSHYGDTIHLIHFPLSTQALSSTTKTYAVFRIRKHTNPI